MDGFLRERYELVSDRIGGIKGEHAVEKAWEPYFEQIAEYLEKVFAYFSYVQKIDLSKADLEYLRNWYAELYADLWGEKYEMSYTNPAYCTSCLGEAYGPFAAMLFAELRDLPGFAVQGDLEAMVIRLELFVEVYSACVSEWQENGQLPEVDNLKSIFYWYVSDYADVTVEKRLAERQGTMCTPTVLPTKMYGILYNICSRSGKANQYMIWEEEDGKEPFFADHKEDLKLIWDKALAKRLAEVFQTMAEKYGGLENS